MYNVTIIFMSKPFILIRDNLNFQELVEAFKEWTDNNLNVYSSFFFEEKGTSHSAHFFKKADGTVEKLRDFSAKS